jgi:hypothetical protein
VVLPLLPSLALLLLAVMVVCWAGTLVLQSYIYSEPVSQLYWRAPAVGLVLAVFLTCWCYLDYRTPQGYNPLKMVFEPMTGRSEEFPRFTAIKKGQPTVYEGKRNDRGRREYVDRNNRPWSPTGTDGITEAIIVKEDGEDVRFNLDLGPDGMPKKDPDGAIRYLEEGGKHRVMTDTYIGKLEAPRPGSLLGTFLLTLVHLGLWFLCLWLLLRFQWSHALGLAIVLWVVLTLTVMPMLFGKAENLAKEKPAAAASTDLHGRFGSPGLVLAPRRP